jgi:hypothetical protein
MLRVMMDARRRALSALYAQACSRGSSLHIPSRTVCPAPYLNNQQTELIIHRSAGQR